MSKLEQYVSWYNNILDTTSRQTATIESLLRSIRKLAGKTINLQKKSG